MTTNQPISNQKIILFIVFIMAAILSSLFVFRMSHLSPTPITADSNSILFQTDRDIKPFELVNADGTRFTQDNLKNHWSLLFFGFTHCPNVCPTTMDMLSNAYPLLRQQYPNLQIVLISLDPERDSTSILNRYTHHYHPDFIGVSGKMNELRKLQSQLGIFSTHEQGELQHTSSIILINPKGKWVGLFKYGMSPNEFVTSFKDNVTSV